MRIHIFSLITLTAISAAQELIPIEIGSLLPFVSLLQGQFVYYDLLIGDEYKEGDDLLVKAIPFTDESDPDIYLSKVQLSNQLLQVNQYPNEAGNSQWSCFQIGRDTCVINEDNLFYGNHIYIGIGCGTANCEFELEIQVTSEEELIDGVDLQIEMEMFDSRIFRYNLPQDITDDGHVIISASSYDGKSQDLTLRVATQVDGDQETSPTSSYSNIFGISAWKSGQVIRLTKDNFLGQWCGGCLIKILIDVSEDGYYHIQAKSSQSAPLLKQGQQMDDMVYFAEQNCYYYNVLQENTVFQVKLTTYSGKVDLIALPAKYINLTDQSPYLISSNSADDLMLDISSWQRSNRLNASTGLYAICVYGGFTSTYTIKVNEFNPQFERSILEDSFVETFGMYDQTMRLHLYKLPDLEEESEKLNIDVDLTVLRGDIPILGALICKTNDIETCFTSTTQELVTMKNSAFIKAIASGDSLHMSIEHSNAVCRFGSEDCYYIIAVVKRGDRLRYKIQVTHQQKNYKTLYEATPHIDEIELRQYKYYKFNLVDSDKVKQVTFELTPLHGDCDLFISQTVFFPNMEYYDQRSIGVGSLVDHVIFNVSNSEIQDLAGDYYIAVYGYSFSVFSVVATVKREVEASDGVLSSNSSLYQGIPIVKTLHDEQDFFLGSFTVDIAEDENLSILIDVHNRQGKTVTFVTYGSPLTSEHYDFMIEEGLFIIKPTDEYYYRTGTYYTLTLPNPQYSDYISETFYIFQLSWRLENQMTHLNTENPVQVSLDVRQYQYFRHYVQSQNDDIRVSISSFKSINADIFVSVHPENQNPTDQANDFSSTSIIGSNYNGGKTIMVPSFELVKRNPSCVDLGYAEDEPCAIYIGVLCKDVQGCKLLLELDYQTDKPRRVYPGKIIHSRFQFHNYHYYYFPVKQDFVEDIYAVLQEIQGTADIYANIQTIRADQNIDFSWALPTKDSHQYNPSNKINAKIFQFSKSDLQKCYKNDFNESLGDECLIVFGVYPSPDSPHHEKPSEILFNFVIYKEIMQLKQDSPLIGYVAEETFTYYIYQHDCADCDISIRLSSYHNAELVVYINKDTALPTLEDYQFKESTLTSDLIEVSKRSKIVKESDGGIVGKYIIGIFSNRSTTFSMSVTSKPYPNSFIRANEPIKNHQLSQSNQVFIYYHLVPENLEVQMHVNSGKVSVYVKTFMREADISLETIPFTADKSYWATENIDSINQLDNAVELGITREENNFCLDCYYAIVVKTSDQPSSYVITVLNHYEESKEPTLIKIGQQKLIKIKGSQNYKTFKFSVEEVATTFIQPQEIMGEFVVYLSTSEKRDDAFQLGINTMLLELTVEDLNLSPEFYLIIVSETTESILTILISQRQTVLDLQDGVPSYIHYENYEDMNKNMLVSLPKGECSLLVTVKSKTLGFYPLLMIAEYTQELDQEIVFPPYTSYFSESELTDWDFSTFSLSQLLTFNTTDEKSGLTINLQYNSDRLEQLVETDGAYLNDSSADAIITVTQTKLARLAENEDFYGILDTVSSPLMTFRVDAPANKSILIEFSNCIGNADYKIYWQDQYGVKQGVKVEKNIISGRIQSFVQNTNANTYFVEVTAIQNAQNLNDTEVDYLIKVNYLDSQTLQFKRQFLAGGMGKLSVETQSGTKGNIKLSWEPVFIFNRGSNATAVEHIDFKIVKSTNPEAVLDQVCALQYRPDVFEVEDYSGTEMSYVTNIQEGKDTYINVLAVLGDYQVIIPYQPIAINAPKIANTRNELTFLSILVALGLLLVCLMYYSCKGRRIRQQLYEEVQDLSTQADEGRPNHK